MTQLSSDKSASVHHVELWVAELARAEPEWGWLFGELGWEVFQSWAGGRSWRAADGAYVVVEQSPAVEPGPHRRTAAGMNHLALATDRATADRIARVGDQHGWTLLFPDRHPYAGGPEHYAAYLSNSDGFEIELVAR
ncbi:VOC family protein [Microlunatus speluncae]|uniref:VOC family protein n=1 Tax=Microlunatus speluncae TaxID=2594267 RepID=UPI0012661314|nr:VOC family protein [Microlunatus speluncae]